MHEIAYHLFQQGRHVEAERLYRQILQQNPYDELAGNTLAFLLRQLNRVDEASDLLRRCLKKHPESVHLLLHLGECHREIGRLDEASTAYRKALKIRPNSAEARFCLGLVLQLQDKWEEAQAHFEKALSIKPDLAEAHNGLAALLVETEQYDAAITHYLDAIRINPNYVEAHVSLANVLRDEKNNIELAIKHYEIATSLQPNFAESYYSIGLAWFELDEVEKAVFNYKKALSIRSDYPEALTAMGYCYLTLGDSAEAEYYYKQTLEISPNFAGALSGLVQTKKFKNPDNPLAKRMLVLLEDETLEQSARSSLHFGLGKLYDDCGKFDMAFEHYRKGNLLLHERHVYDRIAHERDISELCEVFDSQWLAGVRDWGNASERPVFIIGMPRSGTTLTEQIIAAHPAVFGAGELSYFTRLNARMFAGSESSQPFFSFLRDISKDEFLEIGQGYLNKVNSLAEPSYACITDKMPHNFLWLGLIAALFPNAKIIHCRRNPMDNALSIYFQNFTFGHEYSYDLSDIGHQYRQYLRIMEHWRKVLPNRMLELDYEETTCDPEGIARRLLEFCGLGWNDACLSPQSASRAVKTASVSQVRQPVYKSSVQRWKHYEKYLDNLREALEF